MMFTVRPSSVGIRTGFWSRNVGGVFELERRDLRAELFRDINRKRISGAPTELLYLQSQFHKLKGQSSQSLWQDASHVHLGC